MQIKPPGLLSRGKISLGLPAHHITPDSLANELAQAWAPRGFTVYKSALIGLDVVLKKSGWTGVGIKIKQVNGATVLAYNAFSPSAMVRVMAMGLIPILIINSTSWKPLLRTFEQYVQQSPYFNPNQLGGGQAMLPQATASYPHGQPQQQQQQQQQQMQPQAAAPPQYPCQACGTHLQWVAEHQRWYCGNCQQYR
jgi:hypothetical protein